MTKSLSIDGRTCRLFGPDGPGDPEYLLIQPSARHETATLEAEAAQIEALSKHSFILTAIDLGDWILDLMPWPDRNISREEKAGRLAPDTLQFILASLIPELKGQFGERPVILGGYSLGGLFALWAASRTDCFKAIAAASPSVCIKDWIPFARKNIPAAESVYLSLGRREEHVKNQAIARVGDCLREYDALLQARLGPSRRTLVWEEGDHFTDNEGRMARAFAWCMDRPSNTCERKTPSQKAGS